MFDLSPIGTVRGTRTTPEDDHWAVTTATIELEPGIPAESLEGLSGFSHAEIIYVFDRVPPDKIVTGARHPRNNPAWPRVGIFAQRGKNRPNRLGVSVVRIIGVDGARLHVAELDAIDGTPWWSTSSRSCASSCRAASFASPRGRASSWRTTGRRSRRTGRSSPPQPRRPPRRGRSSAALRDGTPKIGYVSGILER